jgi:hypothetical protein
VTAIGPCPLHEITNCSVCTGLDKKRDRERFELAMFPPRIVARHPGICPKCKQFFDVGMPITMTMGQEWICCDEAP